MDNWRRHKYFRKHHNHRHCVPREPPTVRILPLTPPLPSPSRPPFVSISLRWSSSSSAAQMVSLSGFRCCEILTRPRPLACRRRSHFLRVRRRLPLLCRESRAGDERELKAIPRHALGSPIDRAMRPQSIQKAARIV